MKLFKHCLRLVNNGYSHKEVKDTIVSKHAPTHGASKCAIAIDLALLGEEGEFHTMQIGKNVYDINVFEVEGQLKISFYALKEDEAGRLSNDYEDFITFNLTEQN